MRMSAHWGAVGLYVYSGLGPQAFGYAPQLGKALEYGEAGLGTHPWAVAVSFRSRRAVGSTLEKPLVVSPHGMLDPWAVRNSAWKKRIARWLFENPHLRQAACLHALNVDEYQAIRAYGLRNPVAVIPNGSISRSLTQA